MNKKNIEEKFSNEIDNYINGTGKSKESPTSEYNELFDLATTLADKDFSKNSDKNCVLHRIIEKNNKNEKEKNIMKKSINLKRKIAAVAVVCVMSVTFMGTSFAQNTLVKIIDTLSLGHITIIQTEPDKSPAPIPSKSADKEKVADNSKEDYSPSMLVIKETDNINEYACFNVILPDYLPEGYKFDKAEFFKDENGEVSPKYVNLNFKNKKTGKYIFMQQRFADEETAYTTGTGCKVKQIKINGSDAAVLDGHNIHWESDDVIYILLGRGLIEESELIKIAESIK